MSTEEEEIVIAECVKEFINDAARSEYIGSLSSIECEIQENNIESPPEQLWYAAASFTKLPQWAGINPQFQIGSYRVDFMIDPLGYFVNHPFNLFPQTLLEELNRTLQCFVVEIDGFDWHDKTPAQAEHDKARERFIQQQGYKLFRYAAREVLREPMKCVQEIDALVIQEVRKACQQMVLRRTGTSTIYKQPVWRGVLQ